MSICGSLIWSLDAKLLFPSIRNYWDINSAGPAEATPQTSKTSLGVDGSHAQNVMTERNECFKSECHLYFTNSTWLVYKEIHDCYVFTHYICVFGLFYKFFLKLVCRKFYIMSHQITLVESIKEKKVWLPIKIKWKIKTINIQSSGVAWRFLKTKKTAWHGEENEMSDPKKGISCRIKPKFC